MPITSRLGLRQEKLRRLPGRTPLRIKMIAALLALVIIALTVISVTSLTVFRSYLQTQSGNQVNSIYNEALGGLQRQGSLHSVGYYGYPYAVEVLSTSGQVLYPSGPFGIGNQRPQVPMSASWLKAHSGQLTTVPGVISTDNWQIIAKELTLAVYDPVTDQSSPPQNVILVVGMSLGNVNATIGWLGLARPAGQRDHRGGAGRGGRRDRPGQPAPAHRYRADRRGHRGRRLVPAGTRPRPADRGRPARPVAEHHAQPDRVLVPRPGPVRGGGAPVGGADAPVRRGRQP